MSIVGRYVCQLLQREIRHPNRITHYSVILRVAGGLALFEFFILGYLPEYCDLSPPHPPFFSAF